MPSKTCVCKPCDFEYEHFYFDAIPARMQKPIPPCPICAAELTYDESEPIEDYLYKCWQSDGGCGVDFGVEHLTGMAPETYPCPLCGVNAKLKPSGFAIVHGENTTKGASIDVAIGRNAEERWGKIHERKAVRDKFRKETGSQALSLVEKDGKVFGSPIKGGGLKAVTIPNSTVNKDE